MQVWKIELFQGHVDEFKYEGIRKPINRKTNDEQTCIPSLQGLIKAYLNCETEKFWESHTIQLHGRNKKNSNQV